MLDTPFMPHYSAKVQDAGKGPTAANGINLGSLSKMTSHKRITLLLLTLLAAGLTGCPADSALLGTWVSEAGAIWTFSGGLLGGSGAIFETTTLPGQSLVGTYTIDDSQTPPRIDIQITDVEIDAEEMGEETLQAFFDDFEVDNVDDLETAIEESDQTGLFETPFLGIYEIADGVLRMALGMEARPSSIEDGIVYQMQ